MSTTLDSAHAAHHAWKAKLEKSADEGETLDVETIKRADCCDLGQWLLGEGNDQFGGTPQFAALVEKHSEFHFVTSIVASMANAKDAGLVKHMLRNSSQFARASLEVGVAIQELRKLVVSVQE